MHQSNQRQLCRQFYIAALSLLTSTLAAPAIAQIKSNAPLSEQTLREGNTERSSNSFGNSNLSMTQLIHNLNLNNAGNAQEFTRRQNESLDDAFAKYRNGQPQNLQLDFSKPPSPTRQPK